MRTYKTIQIDGNVEIDIKKSRFICHLKRVQTEAQAKEFIHAIKKQHYKATHNCSCFILGETADIKRSSDDGEPSGTAGIPMLTVLENKGLTNVVAVVTRYFGGVKLGAGGLIRAYTDAVVQAVETLGMVTVKEQQGISIHMTYPQYQEFAKWRASFQLEEYDTLFSTDIQTTIFTDQEHVENIIANITNYYRGKIEVSLGEKRVVELPLH